MMEKRFILWGSIVTLIFILATVLDWFLDVNLWLMFQVFCVYLLGMIADRLGVIVQLME